jgi:hypothetical protein
MATPPKFETDKERKRLLRMYLSLRRIIEALLKRMEADPEKISAALVDVATKSIRQMSGLLVDLDKIDAEQKRKADLRAAREDAAAQLPAPTVSRPVVVADPEETLELPFKVNPVTMTTPLASPLKGCE